MSRGIVFRDAEDKLAIIYIKPDRTLDHGIIDDYERIYEKMGSWSSDIVEIDDLGLDMGLMNMKSIHALTLWDEGQNQVLARVAIRECIQHDEKAFMCLLESARK